MTMKLIILFSIFTSILFGHYEVESTPQELKFTQEELAWIEQNRVVTYSEVNWKPMSIIENNSMGGIMGDYLKLVANATGLKFKFIKASSWSDVLEKFKNKEIDLVPGVGSSPEEANLGLLSDRYAKYSMAIVTNNKYTYLENLKVFKDKTLAIPQYYTSYNFVKSTYPNTIIIPTKSIKEALTYVETGKADAFVGHIATALYSIAELNYTDLKICGTTDFMFEHHYLIQNEKTILLSIINKAFSSITQQQKNTIYSKWVDVKVEQKINFEVVIIILFIVSLILLILYVRQQILAKHNKELQILSKRMGLALDSIDGGIWDMNIADKSVYFDDNVKKMLGYEGDGFANKFEEWYNRVHPEDIEHAMAAFDEAIKNKLPFLDNTHRLRHKKGHWIWVRDMALIEFDKTGEASRMIGLIIDITQMQEAQEEILRQRDILDYQAHHDYLTNLPNRALFNDRVEQCIEKAKRVDTEVAFLYIDLDQFKQINDSLGHELGDKVLIEVATRLKSILRKSDTLARLGGDEFSIIIEDLSDFKDASVLAQKILKILNEPVIIDDNTMYVSSSIGISLYPKDATSISQLLKFADAAMYKAKDEGRNNYQFYSHEMTELALKRVLMQTSIRQAINNNEFVLYYQPQVDAKTNKLIGLESLIRWMHPKDGIIPPVKFIELAVEMGMMIEIDKWMMQNAIAQASSWKEEGVKHGKLALNLTSQQLMQEDFISWLNELLIKYDFNPSSLELEITESQIMNNPNKAIEKLTQLGNMGIELAIDDFGTGYSSLAYLKKLPIDKLKIDRAFIIELPDDEEDMGIVKAIIGLSDILNLDVIAEGVENIKQKDFLVENGCVNIQGYLYSKPIPATEIPNFIKKL